jgi:hypothetical protein
MNLADPGLLKLDGWLGAECGLRPHETWWQSMGGVAGASVAPHISGWAIYSRCHKI